MAVSFVAAGASTAVDNASVTPALPAGVIPGDLMVGVWLARSVVATIGVPGDWGAPVQYANTAAVQLVTTLKTFATGDAAPTFTISGGAAGVTVISYIFALRGTDGAINATGTIYQSEAGLVQDIGPITGVAAPAGGAVVVLGGKSDNWTSVADLTGDGLTWTEIAEPSSTLGNDAGTVGSFALTSDAVTTTDKTFTVTGGGTAAAVGVQLAFTPSLRITALSSGCPARFRAANY